MGVFAAIAEGASTIRRGFAEAAVLDNLRTITSMVKDHKAEFIRAVQRKSSGVSPKSGWKRLIGSSTACSSPR